MGSFFPNVSTRCRARLVWQGSRSSSTSFSTWTQRPPCTCHHYLPPRPRGRSRTMVDCLLVALSRSALRNDLLRKTLLRNVLLSKPFLKNGLVRNALLRNTLLRNTLLRNGLVRIALTINAISWKTLFQLWWLLATETLFRPRAIDFLRLLHYRT